MVQLGNVFQFLHHMVLHVQPLYNVVQLLELQILYEDSHHLEFLPMLLATHPKTAISTTTAQKKRTNILNHSPVAHTQRDKRQMEISTIETQFY